ncbi:MAG: hypothetical protein COB67_12095 [SAR324 cluster bacterium]|uniref:AMP-dependent synthetase/ligase domain-containing protein n=1 Tax=SAR324 cluster bacterium TaxID=2024889 RepID=A0A2A4SRP7_9DELT|nr:MAG: hypothetical protein COB67_12095 [SAR324 cluster bacterium]
MNQNLISKQPLGHHAPNIGEMLFENCNQYGKLKAFGEREQGNYRFRTWREFGNHICDFSAFLQKSGVQQGQKVAFITSNNYSRLVAEMAVMSCGCISIPIFVAYSDDFLTQLLEFSPVDLLVIENQEKLCGLPPHVIPPMTILLEKGGASIGKTSKTDIKYMAEILSPQADVPFAAKQFRSIHPDVSSNDLAMIMFTSGTTSFPKGVQLTHGNILSQQKALQQLWKTKPGRRFLCYLPWHHSFGGLFERFFALYSGGCLAVDDSRGKFLDKLFENFADIKPHIYFSVPKVYQDIVTKTLIDKKADEMFFHKELEFVFTAAAPLTSTISNIFKAKNVPVVEGWGLTETSPCCTLTPLSLERQPGVVGFPIPGVAIKLGEEDEILVKGPNVMGGYYNNPEATAKVFTKDGWFKTGDIGGITDQGVKIISRKDRMFKLNNGEKVFPSTIEEAAKTQCIYIKNIYVGGKGQVYPHALVFPNQELLQAKEVKNPEMEDCACPKTLPDHAACLAKCIQEINQLNNKRYEHITKAILVDQELMLERGELTPSLKMVPRIIEENFQQQLTCLEGDQLSGLPVDSRVIPIGKE